MTRPSAAQRLPGLAYRARWTATAVLLALLVALGTAPAPVADAQARAQLPPQAANPAPPVPPQAGGPLRALPFDLATASIPEIQATLEAGTITSEQLVRAYLARIDTLNTAGPGLNAVTAIAPDAIAQARAMDRERRSGTVRGPMHGIPVLLKDNIDVEGMVTTAGAVALADSFPPGDAFLTQRLRANGAIVLGKTNLSEFANYMTSGLPSGFSNLYGQVLNAYDVSQTPSGSSSGSATAAAAALATVTVGTETSGSLLSPATANSLVTVKPTVGLVSRTGIIPIAASQDTAGPMTRSVYDAAALLGAMTGIDPEDPITAKSAFLDGLDFTEGLTPDALDGVRIGVVSGTGGAIGPFFQAALDVLEAQGAELVPASLSTGGLPSGILGFEFKRDLNAYLARLPEDAPMRTLDDIVTFNLENQDLTPTKFGQTILVNSNNIDLEDPATVATYEANRDNGIRIARERIDASLAAADVDALLFTGNGSPGIGARAQYPSVAVPIGYNPANGRPFGMTFMGTAYTDANLLAFAYAYEQAAQVWQPPSATNPTLFRCVDAATAPFACAP